MAVFEVETETEIYDVEANSAEEAQAIVEAQLAEQDTRRGAQSAEIGKGFRDFYNRAPSEETKFRAAESAATEAAPLVGPWVRAASVLGKSAVDNFGNEEGLQRNIDRRLIQDKVAQTYAPGEADMGAFGGAVAGGIGLAAAAPEAFGMGAAQTTSQQVGMNILGNAALSGADTAVRGGSASEVGLDALAGGAGAFVGDTIGRGLARGARGIRNYLEPFIPSRAREIAEREASGALRADIQAGNALSGSTFDAAEQMGNPMLNVDIGSQNLRQVAKKAAGFQPEVAGVAQERIEGQGRRIAGAWDDMTGADLQSLDVVDDLRQLSEQSRAPLYNRAYSSPAGQNIPIEEFGDLSKGDTFRQALKDAVSVSTDVSAANPEVVIRHPFRHNKQTGELDMLDQPALHQARGIPYDPENPTELPLPEYNIAFWDQVQRSLRRMAERGNPEANNLRRQLNQRLDAIVPEFGEAREHAARIFGATDLFEAGQNAAKKGVEVKDFRNRFARLNNYERNLFMAGHAGEELKRIRGTDPNVNMANWYRDENTQEKLARMYGLSGRERFNVQMGIERAMQGSNAVMKSGASGGGSNLEHLQRILTSGTGVGAGVGALTYFGAGQDWKTAAVLAGVTGGAKYKFAAMGVKARERVMRETAQMLFSNDREARERLIARAMGDENVRSVIEYFGQKLSESLGSLPAQVGRERITGMAQNERAQ